MTRADRKEKPTCPEAAHDGGTPGGPVAGRPRAPASDAVAWGVYVVGCRDGSLYTGCTNRLRKRLADHDAGKGAAYTRGRGPVRLLYWEPVADRGEALRREAALKRLSRAGKLRLLESAGPVPELDGASVQGP